MCNKYKYGLHGHKKVITTILKQYFHKLQVKYRPINKLCKLKDSVLTYCH